MNIALSRPLASILISTYNAERYIREAIDSALAQTYSNIEIIVIDDGSTDKTGEIVRGYADPRIRYLRQENIGILETRNRLLRESRGEFITYLDSDDIYLPRKVENEVEFLLAHPEDAAVYCDMLYFFDGTPDVFYRHAFEHFSGDIFEPLLDRMFITNTAFMMRRSVVDTIGFYDPSTGMIEDWPYFLRMARRGLCFGFLDEPLVRYRVRWDSSTRFENQPRIQWSALAIFESLAASMSPGERTRYAMARRIAKHKLFLAITYLGAGRKADFFRTWLTLRSGTPWRMLALLSGIAAFLFPSAVFRFILRKLRERKKRDLFTPIGDGRTGGAGR